ncbi:myosin-11 [Carica papaya]|uniref:myosin-11 n=1 Tax=Carica papaya TaxID=3649 RepID=UPI000B8CC3DF|nr:myosin-11 [Carica papaya]
MEDVEDMDSLFEGMVLFTPSQLTEHDDGDHGHDPSPTTASQVERLSDAAVTAATTSQSRQDQYQEPLDENLFSDLTLVAPSQALAERSDPNHDSSSPSSTTTKAATKHAVSRQVSRKKKRAAGLRIGHGRDSPSHHVNTVDDDVDDEDGAAATAATPAIDHQQCEDAGFGLEVIRAQVSEKLNNARQLAASVSEARRDAIRKRRQVYEKLNSVSTEYSDLEKQLEEACEAEDFEAAERISESLAAAGRERQALLTSLRDAESFCDEVENKMQKVLLSQIAAEEECASLLHRFSTDAGNSANLLLKKAEARSSEEMQNWFSSTEAVEVKKMELEIESHIVDEARSVLNDSIEHSVKDDKREKEFLCKRKDVLTSELQKLLALVKEKEKDIEENDLKIKEVDERIADVISGFQEVHSSIDAKHGGLQSALSMMATESEALSLRKKEIDKFIISEEDRAAKLRELAEISTEEAKSFEETVLLRKDLMSSIMKCKEDKVRLTKMEDKLSEDVQLLQHEASTARASLQELSSTKSSIQQKVASFKQKIFFIDKRAPELEMEKKVAAAARNFKEAARIATEAKSLSVEKDNIQMEMEKAISELKKLEDDVKEIVDRLQEIERLTLSKEKEVAIARFQRLLIDFGATTAERAAALELGDIEEANLLLVEAEAADSEAKKLQPVYNLQREEFVNLPKHFISMELVANLGRKQLAELAESVNLSAA